MISESAFLELDTYNLPASDINTDRSNYVFRNINLKNVMGAMWDKYDKFILKVVLRRMDSGSVGGSGNNLININLKGLDWINCLNENTPNSQIWMPIMTANYNPSTASNILPTNNGYGFNFRKSSPIVNLEFFYTIIGNNGMILPTVTAPYGQTVFTFLIEPAENNQNEMGVMVLYTIPTNTYYKMISDSERVYTYYNFNVKDVCREFWDKYDDFEIIMENTQALGNGTRTDEQSLQVIQMSGFCWNNNLTKGASNSFSTADAVVGFVKAGLSSSDHRYNAWNNCSPVQFKKSGNTVQMRIEVRNYDNSALNTITTANRREVWTFYIRPVHKDFNPEKATLSLNSNGLTTSMTDLGIRNANWTDITLKNVNLRQACQSMWDKYKKFNIFFTALNNIATGATRNDLCLNLSCQGLSTDAQYDGRTTSQTWDIGYIVTYDNGATPSARPTTYGATHSTTFYKDKDLVDLRLFATDINNNNLGTIQCLNGTFTFTIVGVEEN